MKTFTEFENELNMLLKRINVSNQQVHSGRWFMNEVRNRYIDTCIAEANTYDVSYPQLDIKNISNLDNLAEIKSQIAALFQDGAVWKKKRLQELCPNVKAMDILNINKISNYSISDVEKDYTPEQARQRLVAVLMQKFKMSSPDNLQVPLVLERTIKQLREFLKLALDCDLKVNDDKKELRAFLHSLELKTSEFQIKIFKYSYHFKFTDPQLQKKLVDAYLEIEPISRYFRNRS